MLVYTDFIHAVDHILFVSTKYNPVKHLEWFKFRKKQSVIFVYHIMIALLMAYSVLHI